MKSVAILLATYQPNLQFFSQQLDSLNQQDYPNCHIYICDDSADAKWHQAVQMQLQERLTAIPYTFLKQESNMGSNRTFERLTKEIEADYFAYCDQDDIWYPYKISRLVQQLEMEQAVMCYSDLAVIDEDSEQQYASFTHYNARVKHVYGENAFSYFIRRNSVTGCTMLIRSDIAKKALPFSMFYVHDHWLALFSASIGKIAYVKESLMAYRIHQTNQIGKAIFKNITSVDDYIPKKLQLEKEKFLNVIQRLSLTEKMESDVMEEVQFVSIRMQAFETRRFKDIYRLWRCRHKDKILVYLEVLLTALPKPLGNFVLKKIKNEV